MKEELLKEFSEWLNEEYRNNWEIEKYVETMLMKITYRYEKIIDKYEKNIKQLLEEIKTNE